MKTARMPYRIGFVGAGNISKLHLDGMIRHPDRMKPVALCDPDATMLKTRAGEYKIPEVYSTVGEMIARAKLDAAIICTPTHIRKQVVIPLLEAKIPVLCEKPFAETYEEAAEMEKKSRGLGVPIAVNQNFRRHFAFALAKDALGTGEFGKPLHLVHVQTGARHDAGWRLTRNRYVMAVMSIHWFDGYRWLLGEEPVSVFCNGVDSPATEGGDDTGISIILNFPSGAVVSLSETFSSFRWFGSCSLDCEQATLVLDYGDLKIYRSPTEFTEKKNPFDKPEATYFVLNDLMQAVEQGREPETSASDNLKSMRILEAAYRSLKEKRIVELRETE